MDSAKQRKFDATANMECYEEELSPAQIEAYGKQEREYQEMLSKVDLLVKQSGAVVKEKNESAILIQLSNPPGSASQGPKRNTASAIRQANALKQPLSMQANQILRSANSNSTIVVDPRLNYLIDISQSTFTSGPGPGVTVNAPVTNPTNLPTIVRGGGSSRGRGGAQSRTNVKLAPKTAVRATPVIVNKNMITTRNPKAAETGTINRIKSKGSSVVDLTREAGRTGVRSYEPDSKEINFNKLTGRTYPSLVVVARPTLKIKDMTPAMINQERIYLDGKLKQVLMYSATKFTEWLIQQGLVRSEQFCSTHVNPDMTPVKLKLGMYSDVSKFPYSGGYVWISDCCPQRFVSVFSGSIFEGAPHPPNLLLKLMYHWSCQTNVQNVISWVKVIDNLFVKTLYTNLRSVCTAAIHEKFEMLGGPKKNIEVGVISLGTTTTSGSSGQVKIEILGIMDVETKQVRLRAVEPSLDGERNYKKRFAKILEPLEKWVHKESIILTDYTVDKTTLHLMGYTHVFQVSVTNEVMKSYSNVNVMEYLRRVVPRLFQNTLSLLSRQLIQQFLDEVVWREKWGYVPAQSFDQIINHISEQTKLDTGDTLLARLQKIAANPFKSWEYSNWKANCNADDPQLKKVPNNASSVVKNVNPVNQRKRSAADAQLNSSGSNSPVPTAVPATNPSGGTPNLGQGELVSVDTYYYGTLAGDPDLLEQEVKRPLYINCCVCDAVLANNIQTLKHVASHAFSDGARQKNTSSMPQCRYCLRNFVSEVWLNSHLDETHKKKGPVLCLICEDKFRDRTTLILHLHRNHHELEMPYECGICGFRSSQHSVVVDHFYDVHANSEKVQCPFCLKIVALANNGRLISQNVYFFLNHIMKHKRKLIARKCDKCALMFVHYGMIKGHMNKDHCSFKDEPAVKRYPKGSSEIMMPKPSVPLAERYVSKEPATSLSSAYTLEKFPDLQIFGVLEGAACSECEGDFLDEHFVGQFACSKCSYKTCCRRAIVDHIGVIHDPRNNKQFISPHDLRNGILEKEMHCVCGFTSADGDKLAKHLAVCGGGRKSVYPSAERAEQCSFEITPSRTTMKTTLLKKKLENSSSDVGDSSMLGVLGLVRKPLPEEVSSETVSAMEEESINQDSSSVKETLSDLEKESAETSNSEGLETSDNTKTVLDVTIDSKESHHDKATNEQSQEEKLNKNDQSNELDGTLKTENVEKSGLEETPNMENVDDDDDVNGLNETRVEKKETNDTSNKEPGIKNLEIHQNATDSKTGMDNGEIKETATEDTNVPSDNEGRQNS